MKILLRRLCSIAMEYIINQSQSEFRCFFLQFLRKQLIMVMDKTTMSVQELDAEIIREFVEKIIVYKAERVDGHRVQKIKIIWNCIGGFQTPTSHQ